MNIQQIKIEEIKPYSNNPMDHPKAQVEKVAGMIREYGFKVPILVDPEMVIIAGHCRLKAAKKLKLEEVPVIIATDLSEEQIRAFRLADNKAREGAVWNNEALLEELRALEKLGFDFFKAGFEMEELEKLFPEEDFQANEIQEIPEPEPNRIPFSQLGDMWFLGNHRLLCGDSTSQEDVERLMGGEKADLMQTDPPYNIDYEGTDGKKIENDNMSSEDFYKFLAAFYKNSFQVMKPGAAYYVFHADSETKAFRGALEEAGFKFSQCLIWVKSGFNLSRQDYNWRHEPCLYGWKPGAAHYFLEDYTQDTVLENDENLKALGKKELIAYIRDLQETLEKYSTVIREDKPQRNDVHPTMKPLKLVGRLILNSSKKGDIILDPFGGSGSTLITCEQIERQARLIEFDPQYADVIVRRYHSMEREDITLLRNGTEYTWEQIKDDVVN